MNKHAYKSAGEIEEEIKEGIFKDLIKKREIEAYFRMVHKTTEFFSTS